MALAKMSLSWAQNIFMPTNINSIVLLSLLSALYGIEFYLILVHFIQIGSSSSLLYEYKDQSLVKQ